MANRKLYGGSTDSHLLTIDHFHTASLNETHRADVEELVRLANISQDVKYKIQGDIPWEPNELKIYDDFDPTISQTQGAPSYKYNPIYQHIQVAIKLTRWLRAVVDGVVYEMPEGATGVMILSLSGSRQIYITGGQAIRPPTGGARKTRRRRKHRTKRQQTRKRKQKKYLD